MNHSIFIIIQNGKYMVKGNAISPLRPRLMLRPITGAANRTLPPLIILVTGRFIHLRGKYAVYLAVLLNIVTVFPNANSQPSQIRGAQSSGSGG